MKVVGITGGVGSGKSVVMNILKEKYEDLPIIVGITGPFTLTGHLLGIENEDRLMKTDQDEIEIA